MVKTWKRVLLEAFAPLFLSALPQHLAFLHHALSLLPWFGIGLCLCLGGITVLALVSWIRSSLGHLANGVFQHHPTCVFQHFPSVECFSTLIRYPTRSLDDAIFLTSRYDAHSLTLWLTHTHLNIWLAETCLTLFLCVLSVMISLLSVLPLWLFSMMHS